MTEMSEDFVRGNPEHVLLGKPEEKPARVHAPQPPKPSRSQVKSTRQIRRDIARRMDALGPVVAEYKKLEEAERRLKEI